MMKNGALGDVVGKGVRTAQSMGRVQKVLVATALVSILSLFLSFRTPSVDIIYYNPETNEAMSRARYMEAPILNRETVVNNINAAITETFNFNSSNYRQVIDNSTQKWFTGAGANDLYEGMLSGGESIIQAVTENSLTLQATVLPGTSVISAKIVAGRAQYRVGMRVLFTYRNRMGRGSSEVRTLDIIMVQRDTSRHPEGIGIEAIRVI